MSTSWISIDSANGGTFKAYVSLPPSGFGPGLLIIQEIFGVNEHIKDVCDQYASDGFIAVAPDIFWRNSPLIDLPYDDESIKTGKKLFDNLNIHLTASDLQRTVEAIRHIPSCNGKVGSVGFCMGGLLSYVSAARAGVDTAVSYYGGGIENYFELVPDITCPILFHFAEKDTSIDFKTVIDIRRKFINKEHVRIIVHKDASHGFNCWRRPSSWNQAISATARGQSLVHLMESLK
jgi:carboxymethylenebutenolidase